MSFSIGIVGLPNVGKSTLFKAITKKQVSAENYPFCTIDPNIGCVEVPDSRVTQLSNLYNSEKTVYTTIDFVDIAGLVKGAHKGEGLGNQFLHNIREVDAIVHVVRHFSDKNITHIAGDISPTKDIETIELELIMADLNTVNKKLETLKKKAKGQKKQNINPQIELLEKLQTTLDDGKKINTLKLNDEEKIFLKTLHLLTTKPYFYVHNIAEDDISQYYNKPFDGKNVYISAKIEAELSELDENNKKLYVKEYGIETTGVDNLILAGYKILNLITFFTAGKKETKAWTIEKGTKAPQAAGKIHTDFEKGFIRVEVVNWEDLIKYKEQGCKEKGLIRLEGKEYIIKDGDVCLFRFNI